VIPKKKNDWLHKEPFKLGFFKEPFPKEFLKKPIKVSQRTLKIWFIKAPFLVPQPTFQPRVIQRTMSLKSSSDNK